MMRVALLAACLACGSGSRVDGEWTAGFYFDAAGKNPVGCTDGTTATGTFVIFDHGDRLSGQWDLCGSGMAGYDLAGRARDGFFDFAIASGRYGVVRGVADGLELTGEATGLGPGIFFVGKPKNAGRGKTLPPPRDS